MVLVIFLVVPLVVYKHAIDLVASMPEKPTMLLQENEVADLWASNEKCSMNECASITPYWMYRWLVMASFNDYVAPVSEDNVYRNYSKMASRIAINHLRNDQFIGKGMLWWHVTNVSLGIWLQRNWSPSEIATKYKQSMHNSSLNSDIPSGCQLA